MRGEKIPALIMDNDRLQASARMNEFNSNNIRNYLYEIACGWYIIDGLMWHFGKSPNKNGSTLWTTKLKLARREWPIPGRAAVIKNMDIVSVDVTANNSSTADSTTGMTLNASMKKPSLDDL